jgi:mRNA-degrading endonuclease RelE of RelBE toxin-antitoxin system
MKVEFSKKFSNDLDDVKSGPLIQAVLKFILFLENSESLTNIPNIKKIKGHKTAFRIRVGDYRLGFFFENSTILLGRFVHRKDIYKIFP